MTSTSCCTKQEFVSLYLQLESVTTKLLYINAKNNVFFTGKVMIDMVVDSLSTSGKEFLCNEQLDCSSNADCKHCDLFIWTDGNSTMVNISFFQRYEEIVFLRFLFLG